jgi:galactoside O-acetyltransferase
MSAMRNTLPGWISKLLRQAYPLIDWIPGRIGVRLRRIVVGNAVRQAGSGLVLETGIRITGWENISLGDNVSVMRHSSLLAHNGGELRIGHHVSINTNTCIAPGNGGRVEIADHVLIAQNVVMRASDHRHDDIGQPIIRQGHVGGDILVGEGVWIGANAVVTRNVRIGAHAIVGAGAVVTRDVAPFTVVGGVPARLIRHRAPSNTTIENDHASTKN